MPVDAFGRAGAGMADEVCDVLGSYAIGREHAYERVPQFPRRPVLLEACLFADSLECGWGVNGQVEVALAHFP